MQIILDFILHAVNRLCVAVSLLSLIHNLA